VKYNKNHRSLAVVAASIVAIAALSACGGGGGGSPQLAPPSNAPTSSPTVSPSSSPSAAPGSSPQASTSSIDFQSGTKQTFNVTESGYTGAFTESDTCNPLTGQIATVTTLSNAHGAATIQVAPIGPGTCSITVGDSSGLNTTVSVSVATAAITVQ
jgi:hypothetical protein